MSTAEGLAPSPLRGLPLEEQTIPKLLERQAGAYGDKPLLRASGAERSFREVRDAAASAAATLADAGIEPGDRVAAICGNRIELLDLILGCAWLGAVAVPLNTALRGAPLQHALDNSSPRIVFADPDRVDVLAAAELPSSLDRVWVPGGGGSANLDREVEPAPDLAAAPSDLPAAAVEPGSTLAILYTSGTTGVSKGVCCPQAQFYWWGVVVGELLELTDDDVLHTCLPLFHSNALNAFVQALVAGATYDLGAGFSASGFWRAASDAGATVTYLLGAMVNMLLSRDENPGDRTHRVRIALAPATPPSLLDPFRERFGVELLEAYGSTETNAVIGAPPRAQRKGAMGRELRDFEIDVVDENDVPVHDGVGGELVVRSRHPFSFATGYFEMPEATVKAWRNLWFHTGDRVVRDDQGWVTFLDRIKDAIRRRGENISSYEVEQALLAHSAVASAAVFAVASELAEDEVMAAVVVEPGHSLAAEELTRHCEPRLQYFAIPRYIDFVAELPLTENGKVRKEVLRRRGITSTTWDREAAGYVLAR